MYETHFDISDVNAFYSSVPEWSVTAAHLLDGNLATQQTNAAFEFFIAPRRPINGSHAFQVTAGQSVQVRIFFSTSVGCTGGRGFNPTCSIPVTLSARFTPGATLQ